MKTLSELAAHVRTGSPLEIELGDFLDAFYLAPDLARVQKPPDSLVSAHAQGAIMDALLAAVAEHLCRRFAFSIPS